MDDIQNQIEKVLKNPESLSKIKSIADMLSSKNSNDGIGNLLSSLSGNMSKENNDENSLNSEVLEKLISSFNGSSKSNNHINLIRALRPYVRKERAEKIDTAVKILKLTDIAGGISNLK